MADYRIDGDKQRTRAIPVPESGHRGPVVLPELRLFERPVHRDTRGTFTELWREDAMLESDGLPRFVQDNAAHSRRGVVRGLHFQNPRPQGKLVSVAVGEVFDVAVDVRMGSATAMTHTSWRSRSSREPPRYGSFSPIRIFRGSRSRIS